MVRYVCVVIGVLATTTAIAEDRPAPADNAAVSTKVLRYARRVIAKHDRDGSGSLNAEEWKTMRGRPALIDANRDGRITPDELAQHIANYGRWRRIRLVPPGPENAQQPLPTTGQDPAGATASPTDDETLRRNRKFYVPGSRLPRGLPRTFIVRDLNGDGQLTLAEFSPKGSNADAERFKKLDANLDNVVTAREFMRGPRATPNQQTPQPATD